MVKRWTGALGTSSILTIVAGVGVSFSAGELRGSDPYRVPPEARTFEIADHNVGRGSEPAPMQGLWVHVEIRRVGLRIAGRDRSEICGVFENRSRLEWSGGYRVTDRNDPTPHASLRVPAGAVVRKCETLNPQSRYTVVVRRDSGS